MQTRLPDEAPCHGLSDIAARIGVNISKLRAVPPHVLEYHTASRTPAPESLDQREPLTLAGTAPSEQNCYRTRQVEEQHMPS